MATTFDDLANATDPTKGAVLVGYRLDNPDATARTVASKGRETVSLLDFTGPADGNGTGGGTDRTQAFARAYAYLSSKGGGTLHIPVSGTGIYRVDGSIEPAANTSTIVDDAVTLDFTRRPNGGVNGHTILIQGQFIEGEIPIGANVDRGALKVSTATPHGLSVGDWFLLKSQRNALHVDAGENWQLGTPTGSVDAHACYFGEPCEVSEVNSDTMVTIGKGIIFPNYRTDNTEETSARARPHATIQKIAFKENVQWNGGKYIGNGTTIFRLQLARRCSISDIYGDLGNKTGSLVINQNGLENKFLRVSAKHSPIYYINAGSHDQYNSFKEMSSWWSTWDYEDRYGSQGFDGTYILNGTCSICPTITGASYDAHEQGLTFHGGTYGFLLKNMRSYRAKQCGLTIRSRFGVIDNPYIIGPNINQLGAIQFTGWGVDCTVNGGYIEGYQRGVTIGSEQGDPVNFPQPTRKNIVINGTSIRRCARGVHATTHNYTPVPNADPAGVVLENLRLSEISEYGVLLDQYVNYCTVRNITLDTLSDTCEGIYVAVNSVGHQIGNIIGTRIQPAALLIRVNGIFDTTTFPHATWPSIRVKLGYYKNLDSDVHCILLNQNAMTNVRPNGYSFTHRDQDDTVYYESASPGTFTIPFSANFFPLGARIVVVNKGAGELTIAAAAGITLGSTSGTTLSQNQAATLMKIALTSWTMMG